MIINTLIENPNAFFGKFIFEPLAGAVLAYGLAWLALRPKDGRKIHNPFLWHTCGVAASVIGSAIFRVIAMVTFAGRNAYEPASGSSLGFYLLIIPAIAASVYITWFKQKTLPSQCDVASQSSQAQFPQNLKLIAITAAIAALTSVLIFGFYKSGESPDQKRSDLIVPDGPIISPDGLIVPDGPIHNPTVH